MNFLLWVYEKLGLIGGLGLLAVILGVIGANAGGSYLLIGGIVVIVLAIKFNWP